MDDLISRAAAIDVIGKMIHEYREKGEDDLADGMILARRYGIKQLPAVDAAPVVHGRWISYPECLAYENALHDDHIVCSACQSVWNIIDNDTECFDYCPTCGAKMDGRTANG